MAIKCVAHIPNPVVVADTMSRQAGATTASPDVMKQADRRE